LKLLGKNENELKNEMKIVQTISKDINMNFGLEKCARICLKRGSVQIKLHVGSTFENDIKELDPRKTYKYLGIEESFDIQHKNEKEKLKKEYLRRLMHKQTQWLDYQRDKNFMPEEKRSLFQV